MQLFLMTFIFFVGCSQLQNKVTIATPTEKLYDAKADISIEINGVKSEGMAVATLATTQTIEIVSKAKLDVLIVSSCQRFDVFEKLDSNWFGGAGKKFKYTYTPTKTELNDKCPLYFQAFDKSGLTAWAYIAFKTNEKLVAEVECNGKSYLATGFTLCQTKNGFEQALTFTKPITNFKASESCGITKVNDKEFKIVPLLGFCNATFTDGTDWHQLTLLGYEKALIRGE